MVGIIGDLPEDESTPEKLVTKLFSHLDTNDSGHFDEVEFAERATHDQSLIRLLEFGP